MSSLELGNVKFVDQTVDLVPLAFADSDRVKQVLTNLVSNGLKFTDKGSVTIKFKLIKGFVEVSVIDTGHGISEEGQKLLFHKFQQAG